MRKQLENRLAELQGEFSAGEEKLREIEGQQARLRDTLLRIEGRSMCCARCSSSLTNEETRPIPPTDLSWRRSRVTAPVRQAVLDRPRDTSG